MHATIQIKAFGRIKAIDQCFLALLFVSKYFSVFFFELGLS